MRIKLDNFETCDSSRRKHYNDKSGGKHHVKIDGKFRAWWTDIIERQSAKNEINQQP